MAGVAVELHDLADEWERDTTIRARLRDSGVLFVEESEGTRLATNIRGAERHAEVLLPLLPRLRRGDDIGMCTIPQLEVEISKLYSMVSATTTLPSSRGLVPDSQRVKLEAWFCKGFCVLVKRKLSRGQVPRSKVFRRLLSALSGQNWDDPAEPEGEEEPHPENPEERDEDLALGDLGDGGSDPEGDASPLVIEDSQPEPEVADDEMEPLADEAGGNSVFDGSLSGSEAPGDEEAIPASTDAVRGSDSEIPSDPSESEPPKKAFESGEETVDHKPVKVQVFGKSPAFERAQAIQRMLQNARQRRQAMIAGIPQPACAGPIEIHDSLPFGADNVETQPVPEADAAAMASRLSRETEFEEPNLGEEDAKLLRRNQLDLKQASKDEDGACADGQKPAKAPRGRKPKGGPKAAAKAKAKAKASSAKAKAKASAEAKAKEEGPKAKSRARKNKAADPGDAAAVPGPAAEPKRKQKKAKHSAGPEVDRAVEAADAAVATLRKPKGEKRFAKRRMPSAPFQRAKFVAIRAAFESKIKPLLTAFSAHEDYFWTFTGKAWKTKHISLDNIDAEALVAAKAYVEQLVATGILE
ncbi:unnamed protein product [Cladocopium goreaui]|uniref:Uncharacterized protein n=1 Tax=Cladocopium goreaui TaxID=2562237 RepID=A0A9P1CQ52_9DINO|nr:unnamed protein product [Cladocopium goreaui]